MLGAYVTICGSKSVQAPLGPAIFDTVLKTRWRLILAFIITAHGWGVAGANLIRKL